MKKISLFSTALCAILLAALLAVTIENFIDLKRITKELRRPDYYFIGNNTGIAKLTPLLRILFNTQDIAVGFSLMMGDGWENKASNLMLKFVQPGDNVIDLGANYGTHTLRLAQKICSNGKLGEKLFAFEANPKTYRLLKRSVDLNGFYNIVKTFNKLITDKNNQKYLFTYSDDFNTGGAKITTTYDPDYVHNLDQFTELSSSRLDDSIPVGTKIKFMKIDIEGAEFIALKGADRVLQESQDDIVIFMEWTPALHQDPVGELTALTQKYGFKVWLFQDLARGQIKDLQTIATTNGDIILSKKDLSF